MPKTMLSKKLEKSNEWKNDLIRAVAGGKAAMGLKSEDLAKAIGCGETRYPLNNRMRNPDKFTLAELSDLFKALKIDEEMQKRIISGRFGWSE
jgi:hypothetical protein